MVDVSVCMYVWFISGVLSSLVNLGVYWVILGGVRWFGGTLTNR